MKEFIWDSRLSIVFLLVLGILIGLGFISDQDGSFKGFILFIFIYVIFALVLSFISLLIQQSIYSMWLSRRSGEMNKLAEEFNLSFTSVPYNFQSLIKKTPAIIIQGKIENHQVIISDILDFNIFRIIMPWMRHTRIEVDGEQVKDKLINFTFGIPQILTPVHVLREFLIKLSVNKPTSDPHA